MKIFVPSLGRIATNNRDGSEKRFVAVFDYLKKKKDLTLFFLTVERQLKVFKDQRFYFNKKDHVKLIKDFTKSENDNFLNIITLYLNRIFKSVFIKYPIVDLIYSPSDLLVDVIPGLICKIKNKNSKLIICMFLLVEWSTKNNHFSFRKFIFLIAQKITFFFLKLNFFDSKILVLNSIDRVKLIKLGFKKSNIFVIKMPIEKRNFSNRKKINDNALYVGRFHPQKGIKDLIKITKKIIIKNKNFKLFVIGGGQPKLINDFEKEIYDNRLENNISYLGFMDGKNKEKYLKQCKFFFMPSYHESFGLTILEALSYDLKVICYDLDVYKSLFKSMIEKVPVGNTRLFSQKYIQLSSSKNTNDRPYNLHQYLISKVAEYEYQIFQK